jgi:CRP/FNR family transcriptional regulator, cyclic AMP receptor protein
MSSIGNIISGFSLIDLIGFAAAILAVFAASKESMIPLRVVTIVSTLAFCGYYIAQQDWMKATIYGMVTLLNISRLRQMIALAHQTKSLTKTDFPFETLKPFMKSESFEPEAVLFRKGEKSEVAYYIVSGNVNLPELAIDLGPGSLVGEMGMFGDSQTRSLTIVARDNVTVLKIPYHDLQELCLQSPSFGLSLFKLIVRRQVENQLRFSAQ